MLKLPRCLESDARAPEIERVLAKGQKTLWTEGQVKVAQLEMSEPLIKALGLARRCGRLRGGLENIQNLLQKEEAGLMALARRTSTNTPETHRISRLILMSNDGSERFYRACESLLLKYQDRALGLRLNVGAQALGERFFGKDKSVKIVMVEHKDYVARVLVSLVEPKTS